MFSVFCLSENKCLVLNVCSGAIPYYSKSVFLLSMVGERGFDNED